MIVKVRSIRNRANSSPLKNGAHKSQYLSSRSSTSMICRSPHSPLQESEGEGSGAHIRGKGKGGGRLFDIMVQGIGASWRGIALLGRGRFVEELR